jgi:hypothetical protein
VAEIFPAIAIGYLHDGNVALPVFDAEIESQRR